MNHELTDIAALDRPGAAQLTNMTLALETMLELQNAGASSPRMGCLYGPSGYGKTVASAFVGGQTDAAYVQVKSVWTQKTFLTELAQELGIAKPPRTAPAILTAVCDQLVAHPRPIIIDEFDHLVKRQSLEVVRDIHDAVAELPSAAIMLVGEEALPFKLKEWERFHNRVLIFTPAEPASAEDALKLRDFYRQKVEIADDLVEHVRRSVHGITRRIRTNLREIERVGRGEGWLTVDRAIWKDRPIETGDAPIRRRAA